MDPYFITKKRLKSCKSIAEKYLLHIKIYINASLKSTKTLSRNKKKLVSNNKNIRFRKKLMNSGLKNKTKNKKKQQENHWSEAQGDVDACARKISLCRLLNKPNRTRPVPYTPLQTEGKLKLRRFLVEQ